MARRFYQFIEAFSLFGKHFVKTARLRFLDGENSVRLAAGLASCLLRHGLRFQLKFLFFDFGFDDDVRFKRTLLSLGTHVLRLALGFVSFFQSVCLRYFLGGGSPSFRFGFRFP